MATQDKTPECTVKTRLDYRAAPLEVLECKALSLASKVLLVWLFMHGNNWKFRIGFALTTCGISQRSWRKVRIELMDTGFFTQVKGRERKEPGGRLKFEWQNVITDEPLLHPSTMHVYKNEHMQNARMQGACMQSGPITSTQHNNSRVNNPPLLSDTERIDSRTRDEDGLPLGLRPEVRERLKKNGCKSVFEYMVGRDEPEENYLPDDEGDWTGEAV